MRTHANNAHNLCLEFWSQTGILGLGAFILLVVLLATVIFRNGAIASVWTSAPVAHLGGVLYELGAIDDTTLNETLGEVARDKRLHGEILLEVLLRRPLDYRRSRPFRKDHLGSAPIRPRTPACCQRRESTAITARDRG